MSIRATNFVRRLRGLSVSEKSVAFVFADHDNHKGGGAYPSMETVAEEAGLRSRETAYRITQRLVERNVLISGNPDRKRRGRTPTVYHFNFNRPNCDCRITVQNGATVTRQSQLQMPDCDSGIGVTVTQKFINHDSLVTGRVYEGLEGGCSLMKLSQDQRGPGAKPQEPGPTRSQVQKAIGKTAKRIDPASNRNEDPRAHLESGIYREKVGDAYFDATRAGMTPDECVREAITAGALTLAGNRSVELKGLRHEELAELVWERLRNSIQALHGVKDFDTRSQQVVAVVTRSVTDAAMEFWERHAEGGSIRI